MIQRCCHTMCRTFLLGVLVLVTLSIGAQGMLNRQYNIHFLDLTSGLPQNFVNQIFVDSYGFIWISTYGGGAVRYDGYSFVSPVLSGRNGVYSHSCKGFAEDGHQRLWIAFDECAAVLDMHTMQRVIPQTAHGDISRLLKKSSFKIYCDSKGCIWQVTNDSIFHYTFDREGCVTQIASCHYQGNTPEISIHDIERNGTVWCCIDGGLYRLTKSGNQLTKKEISPSMAPLRGLFVTDMLKRDNTVWISTNQGLFAYDQYTGELRHFQHTAEPQSLSHNHATALAIAPDGRLLVGTLRGLDIMNNDNGTFEHWNSTSDERPLPSDFVHCLLTLNGQIWIGTETAGIVKLVPRPLMMRSYAHHSSRPESLSPHPVNAMCIDQHGTLWAGTVEGGLNRKNGTDSFDHWTTQNSALSHNSVSVLEPDDQGRLWIGTWGGGVNMITTDDRPVLRHIDMAPEFVALTNYVGALAYDKYNEALWIGSNDGIFLYNLKSGQVEIPFRESGLIRGCVGSHIDKEGQLWIGCLSGVCIIDLRKGRDANGSFSYRRLQNKLDHPESSVIDKISCFCESHDGTLWLGSNGYGLYHREVNKKTGKETFRVLTTADGLANNAVKGIVEDLQGRLWVTTNNGLSVYDPHTRTFINYGEYDGLASQRFYWNSAIKGPDETIYLGSVSGITEIKGENIESIIKPHLAFTRLLVNNQLVTASNSNILDADISRATRIRLHESDKSFAIDFSSLTYAGEPQGYYCYRLKGFEDEWTPLHPSEHSVRYTSLKPGHYTFEVRFVENDKVDDAYTIAVAIDVAPYFWKSWWFVLFMAVLAIALFYWLYQERLEAWRRQEAEKLLIPIKKVLDESDNPEQMQVRIQNILDNQERIQKSRHRSLEVDKQQVQQNRSFMERVTEILEHNYRNSEFGITEFAEAIGMSKSLLSKRLNAETGLRTGPFIRNYRLSIAKEIILKNPANRNITEIAYQVGFNDPKYFTRCFTRAYGSSPSTYKEGDEKL